MEAGDHKGGLKPPDLDKVIKGHEGVLPWAHLLPEPQPPSVLNSRSRDPCRLPAQPLGNRAVLAQQEAGSSEKQ